MVMLVTLMVVIISQIIRISKHHIVYLKYTIFIVKNKQVNSIF